MSPSDPEPAQIQEIELKYLVSDATKVPTLLQASELGAYIVGDFRRKEVRDAYFDSGTGVLARAGYALRFRQSDTNAVVQLKSLTPPQQGIHRRQEISVPTRHPTQPKLWPEGPGKRLIHALIPKQTLQPLFYVTQTRHQAPLLRTGAEIAELSLDHVTWQAEARTATAWVLEVELKPGQELAHLFRIQAILDDFPFLQATAQSKYERGLALRQQSAVSHSS